MFPGRLSPTATRLPDVGIHLGPVKSFNAVPEIAYDELIGTPSFVDIQTDGQTIVGVAVNSDKSLYFGSIITIDIATGASQKIADIEDVSEPQISEQYIVWSSERQLHRYDRQSGQTSIITAEGSLNRFVALAGNKIAWEYSKSPSSFSPEDGLWAQNLDTGDTYHLDDRFTGKPLISENWILYPKGAYEIQPGIYIQPLQAVSLSSSIRITVGTVHDADTRINFSPGKHPYAIEAPWVAWAPNLHTVTEAPSLHLHNLESGETRVAAVPACALMIAPGDPEGGGRIRDIIISDDLVLFRGCSQPMGYDIASGSFFSVPLEQPFNPSPNHVGMVGWDIDDGQLVWALHAGGTIHTKRTHIFAAPIIAD